LNDVKDVKLSQGEYQGQELTLIINSADSSGKPHRIVDSNIGSLEVGEYISTSNNNAVVDLVYVGSSWIIKNLFNAAIV
jgi:hypothetical protein